LTALSPQSVAADFFNLVAVHLPKVLAAEFPRYLTADLPFKNCDICASLNGIFLLYLHLFRYQVNLVCRVDLAGDAIPEAFLKRHTLFEIINAEASFCVRVF
jgi:hypothetical protein